MRTVIFDLDGTLADTSGDLIAAANACFMGLGLGQPLDPVRDQATAFRGGHAMLRLGFERVQPEFQDADIERQFSVLLSAYDTHIDRYTTLYPGAIQAVDRLRAEKIAVGICTNKPAGLADKLLTRLGVRDAFASLIGSDSLPTRKPDPAPYRAAVTGAGGLIQRSLLIGDTITDRDTARNAGVPCVLVTFGALGHAVADLAPSALLDHFDDLPDLVTRLLP